jgi:hypothetical protein
MLHKGMTECCGLRIPVHRGCTSELYGVRKRRVEAQELRSTNQEEEDLKVVEYLGGKDV